MIDVEAIACKWAKVYELPLSSNLEGGYDATSNRILISDRLTPIQRRCVLAHEISHARHRDVGCKCDSATERRADMEAARMLVNQLEYQSAEIIFDGDEYAIARELNVMPWIFRAYKQWLHDSVAV
ncbi:ImmA/IrrE family metallo-endopeptidase [Bifidobacterium longum]|uniref:ImmA/IrrE family metallo-endopeptidase n=1 Tax=Bifidobacterium longum TaxID=216816 RepID=UPI0032BF26D9